MSLFRTRHRRAQASLTRRFFLRAVGLGISAPVAARLAREAAAQPGPRPTRLFIYFVPHGVPNEHFEVGEGMALDASGVGILSPLAPYKKYLTVLRGLENQLLETHESIPSMLTGVKAPDGGAGGNSIDFEIAQALKTTAHVLGTYPYRANNGKIDNDSYVTRHGGWVTPIVDTNAALDDLFPGLAGTANQATGPGDFEFRQRTLAFTQSEVESLQSALNDLTSERTKLQVHLESLRALQDSTSGKGGTSVVSCAERPPLPSVDAVKGLDPFSMDNFRAYLEANLEASAYALLCGTARVITLHNMFVHADMLMNFPGGPAVAFSHHGTLSHADLNSADLRTGYGLSQKWFYERLADKFLATLDQPDPADPGHTVLDNTTVLTCTEVGDGHAHNTKHLEASLAADWIGSASHPTYLPWTIIGGGGGFFRGNQVVRFQKQDHRTILAALAESMGVDVTIGGETFRAPVEVMA